MDDLRITMFRETVNSIEQQEVVDARNRATRLQALINIVGDLLPTTATVVNGDLHLGRMPQEDFWAICRRLGVECKQSGGGAKGASLWMRAYWPRQNAYERGMMLLADAEGEAQLELDLPKGGA